jgi:hypothetical protein
VKLEELKSFIRTVIQEKLTEVPYNTIDPEVKRLINDVSLSCKELKQLDGYPDKKFADKLDTLAQQAEEYKEWMLIHKHPNTGLMMSFASALKELANASTFTNRPSFFGKTKYCENNLDLAVELEKMIISYKRRAHDTTTKKYG